MEQIGFEIEGPHFDLLDGKFEPERFGVELFVLVAAHGGDIEFGGLVQTGPGCEQPRLLESLQGGKVLLGLAAQAALLNAEIGELALVGQKGLDLNQLLANTLLLVGEQFSEFQPAEGKDAHLEGQNASQTPVGIGEGLHESQFLVADRLVALAELGRWAS